MIKFPGGHRSRVTPVPIPNTEVKPATADGTAWETAWESRSLPGLTRKARRESDEPFFLYALSRLPPPPACQPRQPRAQEQQRRRLGRRRHGRIEPETDRVVLIEEPAARRVEEQPRHRVSLAHEILIENLLPAGRRAQAATVRTISMEIANRLVW